MTISQAAMDAARKLWPHMLSINESPTQLIASAMDAFAAARVAEERKRFVIPLITLKEMGRDYRQEWVCEFINNNEVLGWLLEEGRRARSKT